MAMTVIWTGMVVVSILCGLATGNGPAVAAAAMEGAAAAVELCLSMAGVLCLWMGVMEDHASGRAGRGLSRLLQPVLRRLYPHFARDQAVVDTIAANVSANLLGLGNAATPWGWRPPRSMSRKTPGRGFRRAVYAGGVQYRLHPAHPHHSGHRVGGGGGASLPLTFFQRCGWLPPCL